MRQPGLLISRLKTLSSRAATFSTYLLLLARLASPHAIHAQQVHTEVRTVTTTSSTGKTTQRRQTVHVSVRPLKLQPASRAVSHPGGKVLHLVAPADARPKPNVVRPRAEGPTFSSSSQSVTSTTIAGTPTTAYVTYPITNGQTPTDVYFEVGQDYTPGDYFSCTATSCTISFTFKPVYPGLRTDTFVIEDDGTILAKVFVYGIGLGPQFAFDLGDEVDDTAALAAPASLATNFFGSYIADTSTKQVYSVDQGVVTAVPITGLGTPAGIAFANLTIYVVDQTNNRIVTYDTKAQSQGTLATSTLSRPTGIAIDGTGAVYIADTGNNRIIKIDNQGTETTLASGLSAPLGLALDSSANVFFSDLNRNGEINELPASGGAPALIEPDLGPLHDLVVDAAGRIYYAGDQGIGLISPSQNTLVKYGGSPAYGIAIAGNGDVTSTQPATGTISTFDRSASNFTLSTPPNTNILGFDTISNTGNTPLTLSNLVLNGSAFTLVPSDGCSVGDAVQPAAYCAFTVDFAPTAATTYQGTLNATSDSLNNPGISYTDSITGNGVYAPTDTALTVAPASATAGQPVTFTATVTAPNYASGLSPTGTVELLDTVYGYVGGATLNYAQSNSVQIVVSNLAVGVHSIRAVYQGDSTYAFSTSPDQTVTITAGITTTTALAVSPATVTAGQPETLIATVTPASVSGAQPSGSVNFLDTSGTLIGTSSLAGSPALTQLITSTLTAGTHSVTAVYSGDSTYAGSTSAPQTVTVSNGSTAAATNVTLTTAGSTATTAYEQPIALRISVATASDSVPNGQIIVCSATAVNCTAEQNLLITRPNSDGNALVYVTPGTVGAHAYKAIYLGTTAYQSSTSAPLTLTVTGKYPTSSTTTSTGSAGNYALTGTVVGLGSNAVAPGGTVTFNDTTANTVLGAQALGAATLGFNAVQPAGSPIAVGAAPYGVATGDFNNDGFLDVVVENYEGDSVSVLLGKGDGTFQTQVTYAVGSLPERVLTADVNGDGVLDLIVANTGSSSVSVLLGNGDGTFQTQVTYGAGSPVGLGVLDLNHDGYPDIVAGGYYDGYISVLLNNGDGTFAAAVTYPTGNTPQTLAEGDFNGDGNIDVAVGNLSDNTVGIFLGKGDGTFAAQVTYAVGNAPMGVQVGDFNADGKEDLAVVNSSSNNLSILLGNGDGTFQAQVTYPTGADPVGLVVADFNGDGKQDIAVNNTAQSALTESILLGNGDGTFQSQTTYPMGNFPYGSAAGDFNGDGYPDLAIANYSDGTTIILLSQVTQTATVTLSNVTLSSPTGTHQVDTSYPGDANFNSSVSPTIPLTSTGTTTLTPSTTQLAVTPAAPTAAQPVTFTVTVTGGTGGDARPRATGPVPSGTVTLTSTGVNPAPTLGIITLDATGSGSFTASSLAAGTYTFTATYSGDSNFSGSVSGSQVVTVTPVAANSLATATTLAATPASAAYRQIVTLTANVSFISSTTSQIRGQVLFCLATTVNCTPQLALATSTLNSAGNATAAFVPGAIGAHAYKAVYLGVKGTPAFVTSTSANTSVTVTGTYPTTTTIASTGNPGAYTLTATTSDPGPTAPTGAISFLDTTNASASLGSGTLGSGASSLAFTAAASPSTGANPVFVVSADLNGDGVQDLVTANSAGDSLSILLGNGDGSFTAAATLAAAGYPDCVAIGDFNADGKLDLAVTSYDNGTVTILLGNGDGTFQTGATYTAGNDARQVMTADLNGDGILDLAISRDSSIQILLGNGDGTFTQGASLATEGSPNYSLAIADLNNDGAPDLVTTNESAGSLSILLGNGDGTFQAATNVVTVASPDQLTVGDFNADGKLDIAVSSVYSASLTVLLGKGDGTFTSVAGQTIGVNGGSLTHADFNQDGRTDIAVANNNSNQVTVLLGNGDGTFSSGPVLSPSSNTNYITTADLNGDGIPDLAVASISPSVVTVLLSQLTSTATATLPNVALAAPSGTHQVTASYPGDTSFAASVSAPISLQSIVSTTEIISSISPTGAPLNGPATTVTFTGSNFVTADVVQLNGAAIPTTYVSSTTLTAVIPASFFTTTQTGQLTVFDPTSGLVTPGITFAVLPAVQVVFSGPGTTGSGQQPTLTFQLVNPYPYALAGSLTLTFAPAATAGVDDPTVQFATGGRTLTFTIAANSTLTPTVQLQTGTVAGTATVTAVITSNGVNVTPANVTPVVITIPPSVPIVTSTSAIVRSGSSFTVALIGYSNTREVAQATFHFTPKAGSVIDTPDLTLDVTSDFSTWFTSAPSDAYGSAFTYTQAFNLNMDADEVESVTVTLTNSVGASTTVTLQ